MLRRAILRFLAICLLAHAYGPTAASAHGGGLDSRGCHRDRKLGGYHCHKGPLAGRHFASKAEALSALGSAQVAPELAPTKREQLARHWRLVEHVIDGDTIELDGGEKVRLIGVDTPETVHPEKPVERFGKEASNFTHGLVAGKKVRLEYDWQRTDKYGRTLAYAYLEDGMFVNAEIVKQGFGFAYVKYPFKYIEEFRGYEREARAAGRGLWQGETKQAN
jgi:endonuclease YncB( thermonuclease family)